MPSAFTPEVSAYSARSASPCLRTRFEARHIRYGAMSGGTPDPWLSNAVPGGMVSHTTVSPTARRRSPS
ncbi:MAG TPA: hypothetical protein VF212_15820 [Longimicrobiales bacterium]